MYRPLRTAAVAAQALVLALLMSACGGKAARHLGLSPNPSPAAADTAGPVSLPSPAALPLKRSVAFTEGGIMRQGSAYEATLPHNLLAPAAAEGAFTPNGGVLTSAAGLAYGVYSFGVEDYNRDLSLRLTWSVPPAAGQAWVALANYTTNRWEWFALPGNNVLNFTPLAKYTGPAPQYNLYAAVLLTGSSQAKLTKLRIGVQPNPGHPVADLQASPKSGPGPLDVDFDASASQASAPATITKYEYDFGEGAGFEDSGLADSTEHVYVADGSYSARLRVTDSFGATDTTTVAINVGSVAGYDEVEDNDDPSAANPLPAMPFTGFRGNVGDGGAYDGDDEDVYSLSLNPGDAFRLTLSFAAPADVGVDLYDSNGNFLDSATSNNFQDVLAYVVQPADALPLIVDVYEFSGESSDYTIDGLANPPIARLTATPHKGPSPLSTTLDASASSVDPPETIVSYAFDPLGDGNFLAPQAGATLPFEYVADGVYKPVVRITDSLGNQAEATASVLVGYDYDEVEDNDDPGQANPLTVPVRGFKASLANGPGYPGYDGDYDDYYSFTVNPGDTFRVTVTYDGSTGDNGLEIFDQNFNFFDFADGNHGVLTYEHQVDGTEEQPFVLDLYSFGFYGDYQFSIELNPPTAKLTATPYKGPAPLDVVLDASGSSTPPPGTITTYEFDPEGTGSFLPPQAGPTLDHTYPVDGIYAALVRVTDNQGNTGLARATVLVGYDYDEVEDNDNETQANPLTLPTSNFKGSLGSGPGYPGYDGDSDDYYTFSATAGETFRVTVDYDPATGDPSLDIFDDGFNYYDFADGSNGQLTIEHTVDAFDQAPFYLDLYTWGFYGDYTVTVALNPPTAVLTCTPDSGDPPLDVVLDASGSSDIAPGSIVSYEFDPEGDGSFLAPQVDPTLPFTYNSVGVFAPVVRVTDNEGNTATGSTLVLVGVHYNEIEPNDDFGVATPLPGLHFPAFTGSQGSGPGYHGYDGSQLDFFSFGGPAGITVNFGCTYANTTGELSIVILDQFGDFLGEGDGVGGNAQLSYKLGSDPGDGGGPYYLIVGDPNAQHYGDYSLSCSTS